MNCKQCSWLLSHLELSNSPLHMHECIAHPSIDLSLSLSLFLSLTVILWFSLQKGRYFVHSLHRQKGPKSHLGPILYGTWWYARQIDICTVSKVTSFLYLKALYIKHDSDAWFYLGIYKVTRLHYILKGNFFQFRKFSYRAICVECNFIKSLNSHIKMSA